MYLIHVPLILLGSSQDSSLKCDFLPISFKPITIQTTVYMDSIICRIYPCTSILFKMRPDGSDVWWRYVVRTTTALVVVYVFCAFFEPFKQHIDRFYISSVSQYAFRNTSVAFYFVNIFLAQNLIVDLYPPLIVTLKEHKTSIVYMSDVRIQYNAIIAMSTVCVFNT